jgi:tRNA A-37 threonylcarbamoyl transferase component Bud32
MSNQGGRSWPGWLLVALGGAAVAVAAGPLLRARQRGDGAELRASAALLHARFERALQARAHVLEPRAAEAASLPSLASGLALHADARTFQDLLQTEDWWAPFRSEFTVSGLVSTTGALAMLGPAPDGLSETDPVRRARQVGTASGIVAGRERAFVVAASRVVSGQRNSGSAVVVLGAELDRRAFQSMANGAAAAVGISDGARVVESGGPEGLRLRLSELVRRQVQGVVALDELTSGAAWPFEGGLWLLAVFPAPPAPPFPVAPAALALAGAGLGLAGMMTLLARRQAGRRPLPAAAPAPGGSDAERSTEPRAAAEGEPPALAVMGRYHLLERIGEGGMAEIFVAATYGAEGFIRNFVVKRMHPHLARNREAIHQFVDEARLQSGLIHSNIVPVFDFGMAGDEYFMALEHIHGRDLDRLIRRHKEVLGRPLSLPVSYCVVQGVLEALGYAHSMMGDDGRSLDIVHRDVAPGNVLVSFTGEVKLSDFGIAKAQSRVSRTEAGMVKGNASFMSPEQARGDAVDGRSDLFSAGLVLHYCLTGQLMYGDNQAVVKRLMRAAVGPGSPELIEMDKVPPAAAGVLRRALALDPAHRYQDAKAFGRDLSGYFTSGRTELAALMVELFPEPRR